MTRLSLIFFSTAVACVIGLVGTAIFIATVERRYAS